MTNRDTEPIRRMSAATLQWAGWLTCVGLGTWSIVAFDPNHGHFAPQWLGLTFIFALGVAIAASVVRSRMRMTKAILGAFKAGQESAAQCSERHVNSALDQLDRRISHNSQIIRKEIQGKGEDK